MQFNWMKNKKCLLIFCCIFLALAIALYQVLCYPKEGFIELNFTQEDNNQPVALNENEVFYAGGFSGKYSNNAKNIQTKIYNIKKKRLKKLKSYMNCPRSGYGAIKYDENNILILGGRCTGDGTAKNKDCTHIVENYNIKENKFERINDIPLSYYYRPDTLIKLDKEVLIISNEGIISYDIKNKTFSILKKFKNPFFYLSFDTLKLENNVLIWGIYYPKEGSALKTEYKIALIYNIPKNRLNTIQENNIGELNGMGVSLKNDKAVFFTGDESGGNFKIYNSVNDTFGNHKLTLFGTIKSSGIYLGDNKILLAGGCIDRGSEPFVSSTDLMYGILDLKTNEFSNVKKTRGGLWERYILPMGNGVFFITGYENVKPMLYINKNKDK